MECRVICFDLQLFGVLVMGKNNPFEFILKVQVMISFRRIVLKL